MTEELWQKLHDYPEKFASIALCPFPSPGDSRHDPKIETTIETLQKVIVAVRTVRSEHQIKWADAIPLVVRGADDFLKAHASEIARLTNCKDAVVVFEASGGPRPAGHTTSVVPTTSGPIEVLVGLKGLVEAGAERMRIERELKKIDKDIAATEKKLSSPSFTEKAPKEVVDEARAHKKALEEARARLEEALTLVDEL